MLRQYFAAVQNLSTCCLPSAYSIDRDLKHYILYYLKLTASKRHKQLNMDCACLVHKICGYYYHKKGVYLQIIRSTARQHFRVLQHGPALKCIYPKNKPDKNARNHENLTKRASELRERAINSKKRLQCHLFLEESKKGFSFCWRFNAIVEPKSAQRKIDFWVGTTF